MVSDTPRPARARSAAEKHQRRDDILRAAERLWTNTPYADLSMNQVAKEAKLAKGTLYLYFDTKEELFLALLSEHLHLWLSSLIQDMQRSRPRTPAQVADTILSTSSELAPLRRLLVLLGTVLERNVRPELAQEFNKDMMQRLEVVLDLLPFQPTTGMRLLRHLYALAIGWQQLSEEVPTETSSSPVLYGTWNESFETEFALALRAVIERLAELDKSA